MGSNSGWGRPRGGGHGNPLQCSCLENPKDKGAWWPTVHGVVESDTAWSQHTRMYCEEGRALKRQKDEQSCPEGPRAVSREEAAPSCAGSSPPPGHITLGAPQGTRLQEGAQQSVLPLSPSLTLRAWAGMSQGSLDQGWGVKWCPPREAAGRAPQGGAGGPGGRQRDGGLLPRPRLVWAPGLTFCDGGDS